MFQTINSFFLERQIFKPPHNNILLVSVLDEREVIGFYKDHRIEKIRPITVRKGKNKEIKKERFMRSIGISRQTVGEICNLLKKEF